MPASLLQFIKRFVADKVYLPREYLFDNEHVCYL